MDGAEIIDSLERCERRLAETRSRFVYDEGRAEFAYKADQVETPQHAGLVKLEAELSQLADQLREFRRSHQHEPAGHAGQA